jgi:hypothetical protein
MARGEVSGKKPTPTADRARRGHNRGPPLEATDGPKYKRKPPSVDPNALALSIKAFCVLHNISEDQFFKMKREGWGPAVMQVGSRTLISHEAAAAWRAERELAAKEAAAKKGAAAPAA